MLQFHLVKGPAYHWDFLLLSALVSGTSACLLTIST
jgi:hypothetical protein